MWTSIVNNEHVCNKYWLDAPRDMSRLVHVYPSCVPIMSDEIQTFQTETRHSSLLLLLSSPVKPHISAHILSHAGAGVGASRHPSATLP